MEITDLSTTNLLYLVVTLVLPVLVALVQKASASSKAKALTLLALATANTAAFQAYDAYGAGAGDEFNWTGLVINSVVSFLFAVAAHYGLLKPLNASGSASPAANSVNA